MNQIIAKLGNNKTVNYAFDELVRCLKAMDSEMFIDGRTYEKIDDSRDDIIWVGIDGSVKGSSDDEIRIDVKNGSGIITGSNERSVLIAVYRFMFELGCRWLRPGDDGEIIPCRKLDKSALSVSVSEKPSQRHRAVCIEGAVSYEHVYNVINWIPKVGMNGYFVQFHIPACFFRRWYNLNTNPNVPTDPVTDEDVVHIWKRLEEEIDKRSLMYHAAGHGWTCEPFGIPGSSWDKNTADVPEDAKQYFALVNGKRELWGGIALNTSLCFTNPKAREIMVNAISDYCTKNPKVGYLHVWLSGGFKNLCECENCRDILPSDQYVILLNEIDKKLTAEGIDTKIVFLIYHELLWKPEVNRIENPDRFVMMFAPISRGYATPYNNYDKSQGRVPVAPFVLNNPSLPRSIGEFISHLEGWQDMFGGDSFDFEYHLMWAHYADPGYMKISKVLHTDMASLDNIGLNGMVSCQTQRVSFPTGMPMYSMAKALWDKNSSFDDVCNEYFTAAFGEYGPAVLNYLNSVSELLSLNYIRSGKRTATIANTAEAKTVIERFKSAYLSKYGDDNASWMYLRHHAEMCLFYADALCGSAEKDAEKRNSNLEKMFAYMRDNELEIHNVLDSWLFENTVNRYVPTV